MYTCRVVTIRSVALVPALLFGLSPVLGIVCAMNCDQLPSTQACHQSVDSREEPSLRSTRHVCDHDHTTGKPALFVSSSTRDSVATFVAVPVPALAHVSLPDAHLAVASLHGPPGLNGRSTRSRVTLLRI